jgi:hypothetical protein
MVKGENPPAGKKETKKIRNTEKRINKGNKDIPKKKGN